ncbi:MAG: hypothetical protein ACI8TQ_000307 [Planctomycetota bacterium]|jgi:uncharacterized protein (DUF885 family)
MSTKTTRAVPFAERLIPVLILLLAAACATPAPNPGPSWSTSAGGVEHQGLANLCRKAWELRLQSDPVFASMQKDERYYGSLRDISSSGISGRIRAHRKLIGQLDRLPTEELSSDELITLAWLRDDLETHAAVDALGQEEWVVDPLRGPQTSLLNLVDYQPCANASEREQLVKRWHAMGDYIRQHANNLRRGMSNGKVSSLSAVEKTIEQLEQILSTSAMDSPLIKSALGGGVWIPLARGETVSAVAHKYLGSASRQHELRSVNLHLQKGSVLALGTRILLPDENDPLDPVERGRFLQDVMSAIEQDIYPAFSDLRETLVTQVLPNARDDAHPGLAHVPGGRQAYRTRIRQHTSLDLSPEEIHQYGLDEIARIRSEMSALGELLFGTSDLVEIQTKLREDPAMHFSTSEEVEAKANNALERARLSLPQWFGTLPKAECVIEPVPAHEAPYSTVAYYRAPASDGSRPGIYFINTYAPETRTAYEAEVLAYHEAVPGHHLQISIAQELENLPLIRRHASSTAFVEGWALYTERLCDEMGLYSGNLDRIGMLSFDAWRASRLVVDTGMHAFGWGRQKAIDYMLENTLLAANNIENEVDRYIAWPGQALAYKIGQRCFLELREEARAAFGDQFDIREFHDRALAGGAVTLPILKNIIHDWIASETMAVSEPEIPFVEPLEIEIIEASDVESTTAEPSDALLQTATDEQ